MPVSILSWSSKKIKRVVRDISAEFIFGQLSGCFEKATWRFLVTDCKSLHDAIHKEGAAPSSTDKRIVIELAIDKSRASEGEADLRWIDARYHVADCLTKHASGKSEEVLQQVVNQAQGRITAEETMLETRREERERERVRPRRFRQEASEGEIC